MVHKRQKKSEEERLYRQTIQGKTGEYSQVLDRLKEEYAAQKKGREEETIRYGQEHRQYADK